MALIQVRRDTAAAWTSANTTLASGEIGFEIDTGKFKIGTGPAWTLLGYAAAKAYSDLTGTPNLTVYLTTANATIANITGLQSALDGTANASSLTSGTLPNARLGVGSSNLTGGGNVTWNLNFLQTAILTLANTTTNLTVSNQTAGGTYALILKQDTTGNRAISFSGFKWPGGTAPSISTTANATDILTFISDGTNLNGVVQKDFK